MPLTVQLESGIGVYFTTETTAQIAEQPTDARLPSLNCDKKDPFVRKLLYPDVPSYFRLDKEHRVWKMRKQDKYVEGHHSIKLSHCLGRVYTITPHQQDCVYLRLVLHKKPHYSLSQNRRWTYPRKITWGLLVPWFIGGRQRMVFCDDRNCFLAFRKKTSWFHRCFTSIMRDIQSCKILEKIQGRSLRRSSGTKGSCYFRTSTLV